MAAARFDAGGVPLVLLAERAAFQPDTATLLVADAHIGKAAAFRRLGVPVPEATTAGTLARLDAALQAGPVRRVVFLGDLLHAVHGRSAGTLQAVADWRARHPSLQLVLVRGNHDGHAGDPPADWGVEAVDEPLRLDDLPSLALCHHPQAVDGAYALAGHVHPAVVLGGRAHQRLRLPAFHFGPAVGLLPAFGEFTGQHVPPRGPGDRVFAVAGDAVREVSALHLPA